MKINLKKGILNAIIKEAWDETANQVTEAFNEAFDREVYEWTNQTLRQNGELVGSPRDNVDTGKLKESLQVNESGRTANTYVWTAEHAAKSFFGENGKPGKNWIKEGIYVESSEYDNPDAVLDLKETFKQNLLKRL